MKNFIIFGLIIIIGILLEVKSEVKYPDWYIRAYVKCSSEETPTIFIKDCIAFELERENNEIKEN